MRSTVEIKAETNVGEDLGVFLIITFLALVDFIISCIFFDGVKSVREGRNPDRANALRITVMSSQCNASNVCQVGNIYASNWLFSAEKER